MDEITLIQDLLRERCGLHFPGEQRNDLIRAIHQAMIQSEYDNLTLYYYHLVDFPLDHELWKTLIHLVTIEETYFFRNSWQFLALRENVLPDLIRQRRRENNYTLRIWSAGCSSGEEPYSIAIILRELLPDIEFWNIHLLATDINTARLERAQAGRYRDWSFRNETPHIVRENYFIRQEDTYALVPEVRQMVHFSYLNLVEDNYPSALTKTQDIDIIMCRNVTIYFERSTTQMVVNRFHRSLKEGGWLIVGHSEPLASIYSNYALRNFPNTVFYQKPFATEILPPPPPPISKPLPPLSSVIPKPAEKEKIEKTETAEIRIDNIYELMAQGNTFGAREALHRLLEAMPDHTDALFLLAKLTADEGQLGDVHQILDIIDELNPLVPQAHYLRALLHQQSSLWEDAKASLRRALYADRKFVLAHYYMGELLYTEGKIDMARRSWQNAMDILKECEPNSPIAYGDGLLAGTLLHAIERRLKSL